MSYDLAVFDPRAELRRREAFEDWYDERTEWEDELDYNDPANASPALQDWFDEMRQLFTPLNGPFAASDAGEGPLDKVADYGIGPDIIYVAFSWSCAEEAYEHCKRLAEKHGVGFLDASGAEGAAWFPSAEGRLQVVHVAPSGEGE
ncbi:hypothetical protein [Ideonella sp. YS5]|uniref:hypothetical protein n=1 Tax=Ideonella sp. YS5 TaxID=3453714 RepID=UPI003EE8935C